MTLYLKYRPTEFDEVHGNEEIIEILKAMTADRDSCPHSFLFHGPHGCGKTTLARIVARELGSWGSDFREVDSADFRGIDTIREMRKQSHFKPLESEKRVWVLDECHKLSNDAMNALLKALEDTPEHVYYLLCTTDPEKLIKTIRSRCSPATFQVELLEEKRMMRLLRQIVKVEGENLAKTVYEQIAQDSLGHIRDALGILEQVLRVEPDRRLEVAKRVAVERSQTIELCRALLREAGWKEVATILNGIAEQDPESVRRAVLGYCQAVLLKGGVNDTAAKIMDKFEDPFYNSGRPGLTLACYSVLRGD